MWKRLTGGATALGIAVIGGAGIVAGVIGWGGFNWGMELTNTLGFCTTCHEMRDTVFEEYKKTIHYSNPAGVRAICSDCHVPKDWSHKIVRKIQASGELWGKLTGSISTPEKFEAKRLELAKHEWERMKATDSRECRNCHSFDAMDFQHQKKKEASDQMQKAWKEGGTCIDCHKGIAHKLPDMTTGYKSLYDDLAKAAKSYEPKVGDKLLTLSTVPFFLEKSADGGAGDGKVLPATPVTVTAREGDVVKVKLGGWQQEGAERMFYAQQGKRIFAAALGPDAVEKAKPLNKITDADTDQVWTEAEIEVWMKKEGFVASAEALNAYGSEMYNSSCGLCHAAPPTDHYLANQWIGNLNAMKRFISLDDEQYRFLQKWVQMHAQDTGAKAGAHK